MIKRAKIVATLGPASADETVLRQLFAAGLDVVRLNLSHGDHTSHRRTIRLVRELAEETGRFVPVLLDLMGPRYRLAAIDDGPRTLDEGDEPTLGTGDADLPVEDPEFLSHVRPGERLLIDNGMVELEVLECGDARVKTRVLHGGPVSTRKGINLPDTELPFTISDKDRDDIAFAVAEEADYVAVSFVGGPDDLEAIREVMGEHRRVIPLVAKLERATAVTKKRLEATVRASDAVMVARGDLGVEVPIHRVPVLQKKIIDMGRKWGKR